MLKLIVFIIIFGSINCLNLCDDWIQYKDLKCFKVLEKKGTEEEALGNCTQSEQKSTLITIHSKEEQEFLNNILNKYNNISQNSWIGIKYLDKTYKWMDNSSNNYTNWSEDAVKDGTEQCAQMNLIGNNLGKWTDVSCKKLGLIVCQKNQEISLTLLRNFIEKQQIQLEAQEKLLKELNNQNKVNFEKQEKEIQALKPTNIDNLMKTVEKQQTQISSLIPIGFIYTYLPNSSAPEQLWPQFKWSDVTKEYSGLFFRAEGGESLSFGQIQSQNQSWISEVFLKGVYYDSWSGAHSSESSRISLNQTKWIETNPDSHNLAIDYLNFNTIIGEVRPKNTAIKIFKRIE